jgi:hypothetical protein
MLLRKVRQQYLDSRNLQLGMAMLAIPNQRMNVSCNG